MKLTRILSAPVRLVRRTLRRYRNNDVPDYDYIDRILYEMCDEMMAANQDKNEKANDRGKACYAQKITFSIAILGNPIPKYFSNRAMAYYMNGDLTLSENDCRQALELSNAEPKPLYFLGLISLKRNKYKEAISFLTKASGLTTKPSDLSQMYSALSEARLAATQEEDLIRSEMESNLQIYIESLLAKDKDEKVAANPTDSEAIIERHDKSRCLLNEIFSNSENKRRSRVVPDYLCGKLNLELMKDPVITPSGITYDRDEVTMHLRRIGHFDPISREPLNESSLIPNLAVKEVIEEFF
ncbi:unnamed protein product [Caenorhabditis auriculariae]|uniref:E3 ubiquitin-protein ligase CHIP n=1 Tax=Caenorhabditis auriculariae TaxID=2777116 RepID=A0A8S1GNR1_9PELO|nr:unnamed protein product [Caenorhabditis auriculariae]